MDKNAKKWPYYSEEKARYDDLKKRTAILLKMAEGIEAEELKHFKIEMKDESLDSFWKRRPHTPF